MKHFVLGIQELTQIEQDRRTFQEGIDRAQQALDQVLALISSAQVAASAVDIDDAEKPSASSPSSFFSSAMLRQHL